jgi:large subunit ribosomal protein L22
MADEKKTTKKADAAKAKGEKAEAKKAEKKASKAKAEKKPAAKKETKKADAKKESKAKGKKEAKGKKTEAKGKEKTGGKKAKAKKEPAKDTKKPDADKKAPAAKRPVAPPVVKASARYVRIAPRKARLIADQVRGMHIESARALLQFSPRGAAHPIHKLINSAAANAENNHDLIGDEMRVASITVDEGPTLRRFRPRAMGRATPINKRTSHIRVALTPVED